MTITTDTTTLPPLTEAMTAADLNRHLVALREAVGGVAEVYGSIGRYGANGAACLSIYPLGLLNSSKASHCFEADTWPEAFAAARAWIANHATVHRDNRIRAMALAIIGLTDQHGSCTRAMLTRREFSGAEVDDLKDAACVRASEMSANAPFSVEG